MSIPFAKPINRRVLLSGFAALPILANASLLQAQPTSLRSAAAKAGIRFGASAPARALKDPAFVSLLLEQSDVFAPQNELKWPQMEKEPEKVDFQTTDRMISFAVSNGLWLRGHAMIWDKAKMMPPWIGSGSEGSAGVGRSIVERVRLLAERYRGAINSWDVVNEAVRPGNGQAVAGPLFQKLGWEFATLAFRTARETDGAAQLTYNDYALPGRTKHQEGILRFLDRMAAERVKVDALGIQGHLWMPGAGRPDWTGWRRFLADIASRDMAILVTELDAVDNGPQDRPDRRDQMAADRIGEFLDVTLDERAVEEVVVRSLSDKYEGLSFAIPHKDGVKRRPSPFDENFEPKPIQKAILSALLNAPKR